MDEKKIMRRDRNFIFKQPTSESATSALGIERGLDLTHGVPVGCTVQEALMKRLLSVLVLVVLMLPGCSWISNLGCTVEHSAAGAISSSVSTALQCANSAQVLTDVTSLLAKTNICSLPSKKPTDKTGPIAMVICPVVSQLAASELGTAVPASWQCNPALAKEGVAMALTTACNLIPF